MIVENNTIRLCKAGSCCPTIHANAETGEFRITDDFGGEIRLSKDEFFMLDEAVKHHKDQKGDYALDESK